MVETSLGGYECESKNTNDMELISSYNNLLIYKIKSCSGLGEVSFFYKKSALFLKFYFKTDDEIKIVKLTRNKSKTEKKEEEEEKRVAEKALRNALYMQLSRLFNSAIDLDSKGEYKKAIKKYEEIMKVEESVYRLIDRKQVENVYMTAGYNLFFLYRKDISKEGKTNSELHEFLTDKLILRLRDSQASKDIRGKITYINAVLWCRGETYREDTEDKTNCKKWVSEAEKLGINVSDLKKEFSL